MTGKDNTQSEKMDTMSFVRSQWTIKWAGGIINRGDKERERNNEQKNRSFSGKRKWEHIEQMKMNNNDQRIVRE